MAGVRPFRGIMRHVTDGRPVRVTMSKRAGSARSRSGPQNRPKTLATESTPYGGVQPAVVTR